MLSHEFLVKHILWPIYLIMIKHNNLGKKAYFVITHFIFSVRCDLKYMTYSYKLIPPHYKNVYIHAAIKCLLLIPHCCLEK